MPEKQLFVDRNFDQSDHVGSKFLWVPLGTELEQLLNNFKKIRKFDLNFDWFSGPEISIFLKNGPIRPKFGGHG